MSYEGYEQLICANGHYTERDCYADCDAPCSICGAAITDRRCVDETNGPGEYAEIEQVTPDEYIECPTCHHTELTKSGTYKFKGAQIRDADRIIANHWAWDAARKAGR